MSNTAFIQHFLSAHKLPQSYQETAETWFLPLLKRLLQQEKANKKPLVIGVNGAQGSGKSTVSALFVAAAEALHNKRAVCLSIDDFYLTKVEREVLSRDVHPLLATRGVPGTHDIELANTVINALLEGRPTAIPRFDKSIDDRFPEASFEQIEAPLDLVILEGWCVGTTAEPTTSLQDPINTLEQQEDADGVWRSYCNQQLQDHYQALYAKLDQLILLKAPSFDCIHSWRLEQEQKLAATLSADADQSGVMTAAEITRFIQHYQRLTEHTLGTLPSLANHVFELDAQRQIISAVENN